MQDTTRPKWQHAQILHYGNWLFCILVYLSIKDSLAVQQVVLYMSQRDTERQLKEEVTYLCEQKRLHHRHLMPREYQRLSPNIRTRQSKTKMLTRMKSNAKNWQGWKRMTKGWLDTSAGELLMLSLFYCERSENRHFNFMKKDRGEI